MNAAYKVAFGLALASSAVRAQPAQQSTLRVHVGDPTGASIPNARVHVTSIAPDTWTDQDGLGLLSLEAGKYTASVAASGFATWSGAVEVEPHSYQWLEIRLKVGSYSGPILVDYEKPELTVQPILPEVTFAFLPLDRIAVPGRKLRPSCSH